MSLARQGSVTAGLDPAPDAPLSGRKGRDAPVGRGGRPLIPA